jgi:hypothetical protein
MAGICPPHDWEVEWQSTEDMYRAHCKKCGYEKTFPLYTKKKEGMAVPVIQKVTLDRNWANGAREIGLQK